MREPIITVKNKTGHSLTAISSEMVEKDGKNTITTTLERGFNDLVGVKFKDGGRSIKDGFDCYGLVREVYLRCGFDCFPDVNFAVCACKETSQKLITKQIATGDWHHMTTYAFTPCVLQIRASHGLADHLGVYIGRGQFIHATIQRNVEIARVHTWRHKIKGIWVHISQFPEGFFK